ncbi:hypothetical protein RKD20_002701 [Streptomyces sp. SLBN-8D4]
MVPTSLATRSAQAASSSSLKALSRESMRERCWTEVNSVSYAPATFWVGESGVRSSGYSSSRDSRERRSLSKSASLMTGASFT